MEIKNSDYVIVVTNGHTKDTLVLESLLKNPPAYIGVIGSRHKKIHVENYLVEKGFSEDLIKQIIMPIGLDIKAETPSEIAISIVAQLIQKEFSKIILDGRKIDVWIRYTRINFDFSDCVSGIWP